MSCSADERAADGMEAMLTRKGESVGLGECKRWFWNNSSFFGFSINVIADFERNYVNPQNEKNCREFVLRVWGGIEGVLKSGKRTNKTDNGKFKPIC